MLNAKSTWHEVCFKAQTMPANIGFAFWCSRIGASNEQNRVDSTVTNYYTLLYAHNTKRVHNGNHCNKQTERVTMSYAANRLIDLKTRILPSCKTQEDIDACNAECLFWSILIIQAGIMPRDPRFI